RLSRQLCQGRLGCGHGLRLGHCGGSTTPGQPACPGRAAPKRRGRGLRHHARHVCHRRSARRPVPGRLQRRGSSAAHRDAKAHDRAVQLPVNPRMPRLGGPWVVRAAWRHGAGQDFLAGPRRPGARVCTCRVAALPYMGCVPTAAPTQRRRVLEPGFFRYVSAQQAAASADRAGPVGQRHQWCLLRWRHGDSVQHHGVADRRCQARCAPGAVWRTPQV
ncbi:hypothetical protein GGF37_005350, partial [Kickxella alabastrina]